MTVNMWINELAVSALPQDHPEVWHFTITVQYRGDGKYAVTRYSQCLGTDGEWDYEPIPSSRTDRWIANHRFDYDTARDLAAKAAPGLTVNGWTVERVLAQEVDR